MMKRQSASRSVAVRVSALVGTLIVIMSACMLPSSAAYFDKFINEADSVSLSSPVLTGAKQTFLDLGDYAASDGGLDLSGYTEEDPFYVYFYLYNEGYDYEDLNPPAGCDPLVNLNFAYFNDDQFLTYRWSGGIYTAPVQHQIRKQYNGSFSKLWEHYTYAPMFNVIDELFIRMWYNETTDQLVCRVTVFDEYVEMTNDYYLAWGNRNPRIRLIVRDRSVTFKYAFGQEARALYAMVNVDDIYNQGVTAGMQEGYHNGWEDGNASGFNDGYDQGVNEGYLEGVNAGEMQGYDRGYAEGRDDGYDEGFKEAGTDALKGFADYATSQGATVSDPSTIGSIYKAIRDKGWTEAVDQGTLTTKLIWTALEAPINIVLGSANFEVFGINFAGITFSILAAVIVLFILRVIVDIVV